MTRRPPRPAPVVSSIACHVAEWRWANRRETRPPIEWATRCTGSPAPNALTSASSRAALLSMSSRQSKGNGRTCQRVSSSSRIGTYVSGGARRAGRGSPPLPGSPSGVSSRSPIRPPRRRTKSIQIRSTSPLRSTESSSVPMIPGRTRTFPSLPRRRPRAAARRARSNASAPSPCSRRSASRPSIESRVRRTLSRSPWSSAACISSMRGVSGVLIDRSRTRRAARDDARPVRRSIGVRRAPQDDAPFGGLTLEHHPAPRRVVKRAAPRRWAAGRRPRRSRGSSPRGSRSGARRSSRAGSRGR